MSGAFARDAFRYHGQGANVLPIAPGTKKPPKGTTWKRWQDARQTPDDLEELVRSHSGADIGIILGAVSGLVDIDTDGPEGEASLRALGLPLPPTVSWQSLRGVHRLYRAPGGLRKHLSLRPCVDLLGDGAYAVAPSSPGRTWYLGDSLDAAVPLPEAWREFLRTQEIRPNAPVGRTPRHLGRSVLPLKHIETYGAPPGMRNTSLARLVGRWITQGRTPEEVIRRARAWAFKNAPRIPGESAFTLDEAEAVARSILRTREAGRSLEARVWHLGRANGLRGSTLLVLAGLVMLWQEVECPPDGLFYASAQMVAEHAGVDRKTATSALERLESLEWIEVLEEASNGADGRRAPVVAFRGRLSETLTNL